MKTKPWFGILVLAALTASVANADPVGTAFTYQGRLTEGGQPAGGTYDLRFTLYGAASSGTALAGPLTKSPISVSEGVFVTSLDFGSAVFDGQARWLEIGVRSAGVTTPYTVLAPRQELTPTPYALYAATASVPPGGITADKIASGAVTAAKLDPSIGLWNKSGNNVSFTSGWVGIGTSNPDAQLDLFGVLKFGAAGGYWSDMFHNLYWGGTPATFRNTAQGPGTRLWIRGGANQPAGFGVQLSQLATDAPAGSDANLMNAFQIDSDGKAYFINDVSINGERGGLLMGSSPAYHSMLWHNLHWTPDGWVNTAPGPGTILSLDGGSSAPSGLSVHVSQLATDAPAGSAANLYYNAFRIAGNQRRHRHRRSCRQTRRDICRGQADRGRYLGRCVRVKRRARSARGQHVPGLLAADLQVCQHACGNRGHRVCGELSLVEHS